MKPLHPSSVEKKNVGEPECEQAVMSNYEVRAVRTFLSSTKNQFRFGSPLF